MAKQPKPDASSTEEGAPRGGAPLFPSLGTEWSYLDVARIEPAEEVGFLGRLDLSATEETIKGRFGGGKFTVRARNDRHQVMSNRTVDVAGDPIFISDTARDRWLRGQGRGSEIPAKQGTPAPAPAAQSFGLSEIVALFQGMSAMQAQQQQTWAQAQAEQRRQESEERRAAEDRRREEDRRRDDARQAEETRREERRAREEEAARARDRDFMKTTIEMVTARPVGGEQGQMQAFITGLTTALKLRPAGGDGGSDEDDDDREQDPIAETIQGAVRGLVDSIAGRKGEQPPSSSAPAPAAPGGPEPVTVTGALAQQVTSFVHKAAAKGQDPNKLLAGAVAVLDKKLDEVKAPATTSTTTQNGASAVRAAAEAIRAKEGTPAAG